MLPIFQTDGSHLRRARLRFESAHDAYVSNVGIGERLDCSWSREDEQPLIREVVISAGALLGGQATALIADDLPTEVVEPRSLSGTTFYAAHLMLLDPHIPDRMFEADWKWVQAVSGLSDNYSAVAGGSAMSCDLHPSDVTDAQLALDGFELLLKTYRLCDGNPDRLTSVLKIRGAPVYGFRC